MKTFEVEISSLQNEPFMVKARTEAEAVRLAIEHSLEKYPGFFIRMEEISYEYRDAAKGTLYECDEELYLVDPGYPKVKEVKEGEWN